MAKKELSVFVRDQRTGSMKELLPGESNDIAPTSDHTRPPPSRVLVADDVEDDRLLTIWQLGKTWPVERDLIVECAADGEEALEKIRRNCYALVVLDWNMPLQDGGMVLRTMRENGLGVPVVVVSGQLRETIAREVESMAATFVNKTALDSNNFGNAIATSIQLQESRRAADVGQRTMSM